MWTILAHVHIKVEKCLMHGQLTCLMLFGEVGLDLIDLCTLGLADLRTSNPPWALQRGRVALGQCTHLELSEEVGFDLANLYTLD